MITTKPTWIYKPVHVPNLNKIRKEFQYIHENFYIDLIPNWIENQLMDHLFPIEKEHVETYAPTYIQFLKDLGLYSKWALTIFSPTAAPYNKKFIVHVDNYNWETRSYGLNVPVQNCHDSWTVFYKTKKAEGTRGIMPWYPDAPCFLDHELDGELDRLPAEQPAFVNVNAPHRPQTEHGLPRLIASSRFYPEIHDFNFDQFSP